METSPRLAHLCKSQFSYLCFEFMVVTTVLLLQIKGTAFVAVLLN